MAFTPKLKEIEYLSRHTNTDVSRMDVEEYERIRQGQLIQEFNAPNMSNVKLMESLLGQDPAYAKHMLEKNDLLKAFAYKMGGGVNLLQQPVCGRCEGVATWGDFSTTVTTWEKTAYCDACGSVTRNPITVREYLAEYVNKVDMTTLEAVRPKLNEIINLIDKEEMV